MNRQTLLAVLFVAASFRLFAQDQQHTKQVFARAIPAVPGAVICPNYRAVSLMIDWYRAQWQENFQDQITKGQSRLLQGEPSSPPPLTRYGCALAPAGTPMALEIGNVVPVVTATLPNGKTVRGVTDPGLIQY